MFYACYIRIRCIFPTLARFYACLWIPERLTVHDSTYSRNRTEDMPGIPGKFAGACNDAIHVRRTSEKIDIRDDAI